MLTDAPTWENSTDVPTWEDSKDETPTWENSSPEPGRVITEPLKNVPPPYQPGDYLNPGTPEQRMAEIPAIYGAALSAPGAIIDAVLPKKVSEFAFKPLANPTASPEDEAFRLKHPVVGGLEAATVELAKSFTSPVGIATLGMGALPKALQRGVSLAFAGQMASQFPGLASQISDTWKLPDSPERTKELTRLFATAAGTGVFTALAAQHGLSPSETITPTTGEPSASDITKTEIVPQLEVRPPVGESPPLRQQGEVAGVPPPEGALRRGENIPPTEAAAEITSPEIQVTAPATEQTLEPPGGPAPPPTVSTIGGGRSSMSPEDQARHDLNTQKMSAGSDFAAEVAAAEDLRPTTISKTETVEPDTPAPSPAETHSPTSAIKQPLPISEDTPPPKKIDQSSEFAPPSSENPPPSTDVGPGLGAAKLGEVAVQGNPDIYGVANRVQAERAKALGAEPPPPGKGISAADSVERGRELIKAGRSAEGTLDLIEKTHAFSSEDVAVIRAHGEELASAARKIESKSGTDSDEYRSALKASLDWDSRIQPIKTEWSRSGKAMQGETDIDTGSFTGLARAFKEQTGKDFTPKQEKIAKRKSGAKKAADSEAATAKEKLFNHLEESVDATTAEKRALDAAHKTVREWAIKKADAETAARVAKSDAELKAAQARVELASRNGAAADKLARDAATRLAAAENRQRVKEANRKETVQAKAAKDALDAANKSKRDAATKLADEEVKQRKAQTKREQDIAKVEVRRAQKSLEAADKAVTKAAAKAAKAESQLRVARADKSQFLWDKAREYIDQGMENFDDIRHKLAVDTGMSVDEVTASLGKTKQAKRLTNELWKKQQIARRLGQMAKQWLRDTTLPGYRRAIENVPKILFSMKVGFHGTVALGTHAPAVAFQPRFWKTYVQDFGKMYKMVGSPSYYEHQISDLVRRKNYITARRAGLVNDPVQYEDFNSPDTTKYLAKLTTMGNRGYAVLKILRQDMFDQHWNNLPRTLQQPEMAIAIADAVNHATGVVKISPPKGTAAALFAPRLEMSRVAWLLVDPAIAMKTAIEWKTATRAEKYFAMQQFKEKMWVAGTLYSLLALNQGFLSATDSKQKVNGIPEFAGGGGFDPMKGDFMKFKAAGMQLSYGNAMLTMARLPVRLYQIRTSDGGKLKNLVHPDENTYTVLGEYARSQMSPFASLVSSLWFKADWQNRPLPSSNRAVPKRLKAQGVKPYTWPEFWSEQVLPIPFEEAAREVWHAQGMSTQQQNTVSKVVATIAIMGATGARLSDDWTLNEKRGVKP